MNKFKKWVARVLAVVLTLATLIGFIVPAFAYEFSSEDIKIDEETGEFIVSEELTETIGQLFLDYDVEPTEGKIAEIFTDIMNDVDPTQKMENWAKQKDSLPPLPDGFEYHTDKDGNQNVVKTAENTKIAIHLNGVPVSMNNDIVAFIGNMETHEVKELNFKREDQYLVSIDLDDGYYVIYTNNYVYEDSLGEFYAVNKHKSKYIYTGDNLDRDKFPVQFEGQQNIYEIDMLMTASTDGYTVVKDKEDVELSSADLIFPESLKLQENIPETEETTATEEDASSQNEKEDEKPIISSNDDQPDDQKDKKKENGLMTELPGFWTTIGRMLWRTKFLLLLLAAVGFVYFRLKIKKKKDLEEQLENDRYDDGSIL